MVEPPPTPRVVTVADPAAEAEAYARRLGADVARDRRAVEQAIAARAEAAARWVGPGSDELARLRLLAGELARAERIRAHTERRVAEAGIVPPPKPPPEPVVDEARRAAATELVAAESARDSAVVDLAAAEAAVSDAEAQRDAARQALEETAADDLPHVSGLGREPGTAATSVPERTETAPSSPGDRAEIATVALDAAVDRWEEALVTKEAADTHLASAQQQWHALAGPGADPRDPDALLVMPPEEPEPEPDTTDLTALSPTLNAVASFHRKVQARWRVQWAAVGGGEPPEPQHLDVALARLQAPDARTRPLVIVEPRQWAAADDLGQLLGRLPSPTEVIVIEKRSF